MISLEENEEVYKRQRFNRPLSCIDCIKKSTSQFIDEFTRSNEAIVWLDYVKPADLRKQVEEFQALINKLLPKDIIKITLNANPSSYVSSEHAETERRNLPDDDERKNQTAMRYCYNARIRKLEGMLGDLFPAAQIKSEHMTQGGFPGAILLILKFASEQATKGQSISFQPLTAFSYADGQQMLTMTGIILEKEEIEEFFEQTKINDWGIGNTNWNEPRRINVPEFTVKERLCVDSLLPGSNAKQIQDELEFYFGGSENKSLEMLETYALFYRHSPFFSRVLI